MLELDAGVIGRELPVGFGVMGIAISLPCFLEIAENRRGR
jgi:hypothetical protein